MSEVVRTWLRFDDVECVRCRHWCGPMGGTCYVIDNEGVVCVGCTIPDEKARAISR